MLLKSSTLRRERELILSGRALRAFEEAERKVRERREPSWSGR